MLRLPVESHSEPSSQQPNQLQEIPYDRQRALSTVDYLAELIPNIPEPEDQVTNYALVGEILWRYDPVRARDYIRTAFWTIDRVKVADAADKNGRPNAQQWTQEKKHQLRLQVLRCAARLDRQLSRELVEQWKTAAADDATHQESLDAQELMDLATVLLENDPEAAVNLAQASLDHGISSDFGAFLTNLRQTDPDSADRLFDSALEAATRHPGTSVNELASLLPYAFPQGAEEAINQGSSIGATRTGQLLSALASKLTQPEPAASAAAKAASNSTPGSALSLAERSSLIREHLPLFEQYSPENMPALESASHQSASPAAQAAPPTTSQPVDHGAAAHRMGSLDSIVPAVDQRTRDQRMAQAAASAAHQGNFAEAEQLLRQIQDSRLRQQTLDLANLEMALQALAADDYPQARRYALDISQVKQRATIYLMAAEKLFSRGESDRALFWLNEAYDFTSRLKDSQEKVWTLFRLINATLPLDSPHAFDMAQSVVLTLNHVPHSSRELSLTRTLQQASLQEYIIQAFAQLGRADFDRALYLAMQLQVLDTRVLAELSICHVILVGDLSYLDS
jgi:hypothetical protein